MSLTVESTRLLFPQRKCISDMVVPASLAAPPAGKANEGRSYVVPKGHYLLACPAVSQVDPRVWRDAQKWDPLRWLDPAGAAAQAGSMYSDEQGEKVDYGWGAVSKGTESPYQPFGAGRHRCIGEQVCLHSGLSIHLLTVSIVCLRSTRHDSIHNRTQHGNAHREPCAGPQLSRRCTVASL
jgi:hypothetical protein